MIAARLNLAAAPASRRRSQDDLLAEMIAQKAAQALLQELATWPKPGLVSYRDTGSHRDMDASMLRASIGALRPFFADLARAGREQADMNRLRAIGLEAEVAMLAATGGVNTHRGAIFGLGLLCAAAGATARLRFDATHSTSARLGDFVARRWGDAIRKGPIPMFSHGTAALRHYGVGGARAEAISGFRSIYDVGLPALRRVRAVADEDSALVETCFALIAAVGDTNIIHRGGMPGARYAADAAAGFLAAGGVDVPHWCEHAARVHGDFIDRNLSPGGCADLLAMTLFVDALETGA
jgi:triphosphoribosyl-dephospho-CoA synthase